MNRQREIDAGPHDGSVAARTPSEIVDLGDIKTACGTEMLVPVWVRIFGATKNPMFSFKLVR